MNARVIILSLSTFGLILLLWAALRDRAEDATGTSAQPAASDPVRVAHDVTNPYEDVFTHFALGTPKADLFEYLNKNQIGFRILEGKEGESVLIGAGLFYKDPQVSPSMSSALRFEFNAKGLLQRKKLSTPTQFRNVGF